MTALRDAAQALLDALDSKYIDECAAEINALRAALSAPQPAADERVAEHVRLVDDYANDVTGFATMPGHASMESAERAEDRCFAAKQAVEASARALLAAGREDAEHAAMYRWFRLNREVRATDGTMLHVYDDDGCILYGNELDAAIRSAMQKGTP